MFGPAVQMGNFCVDCVWFTRDPLASWSMHSGCWLNHSPESYIARVKSFWIVSLENIGFKPLQLRRVAIALADKHGDDSTSAATGPSVTAAAQVAPVSAFKSVGQPTGSLGATPTAAPKIPRRNVYISPFMSHQDQEEEVVRVRRLMTELKVPGGTLRRVMPGKREWQITPL